MRITTFFLSDRLCRKIRNTISDGNTLSGAIKYVLHFEKDQSSPVDGFWSLTMFNQGGFLFENPINRYAIGNPFPLKVNKDCFADLYFPNAWPRVRIMKVAGFGLLLVSSI
jgi:hypothetical protein